MDPAENPLEFYLQQLARGDRQYFSAALELLANEILYTPVTIGEASSAGNVQKFKVVTQSSGNKKLVPTFTSEDYFANWAGEDFQCLPVTGADLAVTLPSNSWLVVNPGMDNSIELSPEELEELIEADLQRAENQVDSNQGSSEEDVAYTSALAQTEQELQLVFSGYPEVREAYYFEQAGIVPEGALGLLTENLSSERRFTLIAEIGEVARNCYGFVGAIETYDDLHSTHSNSWTLFSPLTPFYVYDENANVDYDYAISTAAAEEIVTGHEAEVDEAEVANSEESALDNAWDKIRTKGPELLKVLGLVKDRD